jgi:uroporphyrinogen-III synthase
VTPGDADQDAPYPSPPVILITRPEAQGRALARRLGLKGWAPVLCALTVLRPLRAPIDLSGLAGLVFTSANAVRAADLPPEARALPAWCVGPATAAAARDAGFAPRVGPSDAAALAAMIVAARPDGPLLHLRGVHGTDGLRQTLTKAGVALRDTEVYEMVALDRIAPPAADALLSGEVRAAAFYSPRTAQVFADRIAAQPDLGAGLHRVAAAAISTTTARILAGLGFAQVLTAALPDGDAMDGAIARLKTAPRRI